MVHLTPHASLAVDRGLWAFGTPVWVDSYAPADDGGVGPVFRHLMIAQDTGTAIRGAVRGDVYWGWGDKAAHVAGHMKSSGGMVVLLPKPLARQLLAQPMMRKPYQAPDHELWVEVARSLKPLAKRARKDAEPAKAQAKSSKTPAKAPIKTSVRTAIPIARPEKTAPPQLSAFDRRTSQRLMRGQVDIDARIDLHGIGIEMARIRLSDF